jgi:hypothetical protein
MKLFKSLTFTTAALILMGCAQGSGTAATPADTSSKAPRVYTPKLASDLVDRSGEVQSVQGIDPRKYFVANEIALNAVDADGDGIWDDVMERIKDDPIWNEVDNKLIVQTLIGRQGSMMTKSIAQVIDPQEPSRLARGCFYSKYPDPTKYYDLERKFYKVIESAVFTSKPRVLAYKYGDLLANGQILPGFITQPESCK